MDEKKVRKEVEEWRRTVIRAAIEQEKQASAGDFLMQTLWAVAAERNPEDIPLIMEIVQKGTDAIRLEAGKVLLAYGESATEHLLGKIHENSPESTPPALVALGMMRRESDTDLILEMAGHEDAGIRCAAAESLGLLGQQSVAAILKLYGLLEDESDDVKCAASHAFVLLCHSDAAIPMVECAAGVASSFHRVKILEDVSIMKNPEVTPYLLDMIRTEFEQCREDQFGGSYGGLIRERRLKPLLDALKACMAPAYCDEFCQILHPDPMICEIYAQEGGPSMRDDYFRVHQHLLRIAKVCGDSYADRLSFLVREYLKEADAFLSLRDQPFSYISDFPAYEGVRTLSSLGPRGKVCAYELLHESEMPSLVIIAMALSEDEEGLSSLLKIALESDNKDIRDQARKCLFKGDIREILQKFITLPRRDEGTFTLCDLEFATKLNNYILDRVMAGLFSPDPAKRKETVEYFLYGAEKVHGADIDEQFLFMRKVHQLQMANLRFELGRDCDVV